MPSSDTTLLTTERSLLEDVLADFDGDAGRVAHDVLRDSLLDRGHPWGRWMSVARPERHRDLRLRVEAGVYAPLRAVVSVDPRTGWTRGFATTATLRVRRIEDLNACAGDPLWRALGSLNLASRQGSRVPRVAAWVAAMTWPRLSHLGVEDSRLVEPLLEEEAPGCLTSLYLVSAAGSGPRLLSWFPPGLDDLHLGSLDGLSEAQIEAVVGRGWQVLKVDRCPASLRATAVDRVERLEIGAAHHGGHSLVGTRASAGFEWQVHRNPESERQDLVAFVADFPASERQQILETHDQGRG